jgi:hypothetical protein
MDILTVKQYAEIVGCTSQNITKKIRAGKNLIGVSRIENPHIRCLMLVMKKNYKKSLK